MRRKWEVVKENNYVLGIWQYLSPSSSVLLLYAAADTLPGGIFFPPESGDLLCVQVARRGRGTPGFSLFPPEQADGKLEPSFLS